MVAPKLGKFVLNKYVFAKAKVTPSIDCSFGSFDPNLRALPHQHQKNIHNLTLAGGL